MNGLGVAVLALLVASVAIGWLLQGIGAVLRLLGVG